MWVNDHTKLMSLIFLAKRDEELKLKIKTVALKPFGHAYLIHKMSSAPVSCKHSMLYTSTYIDKGSPIIC